MNTNQNYFPVLPYSARRIMTWPQRMAFVNLQMSLLTSVWPGWQLPSSLHIQGGACAPLSWDPHPLMRSPESVSLGTNHDTHSGKQLWMSHVLEMDTADSKRDPVIGRRRHWRCALLLSSPGHTFSSRLVDMGNGMGGKKWEVVVLIFQVAIWITKGDLK